MLETRTDKCRAFRKWLTNEVLPALNHKGSYSVGEGKQLILPEKPYEYYDKTWKGEPVLSSDDFAQLAGVSRSTVSWHFRKNDFTNGVDFYLLRGKDASAFRAENPRAPRNASNFYLITASGFRKLCKYVGAEVEEPKIFIEMKEEPKPTGDPLIFIPKKYHEHLEEIRFELEAIKQMTYLLDIPRGCMIDKETRLMYQDAICRRVKGMQNLCCNFAFTICMISKER